MKNVVALVFLMFSNFGFSQEKFEVYFDFAKEVPNQTSSEELQQWISKNPDAVVSAIYGYCDSIDNNLYNKKLSEKRVRSVLQILEQNEVAIVDELDTKALGEEFNNPGNNEMNRRVGIFYRVSKKKSSSGDTAKKKKVMELPEPVSLPLQPQFAKAKKGDIIRIENIKFHLDSEEVMPESQPVLLELYEVMLDNPEIKIEIHGHICCNPDGTDTALSFRRAKYIFTYLRNKGIGLNRLGFKGFGSSRPIYKISEKSIKEERANRRVEILVTQAKTA